VTAILSALVLTNLLYVAGAVVVATLVSALYVLRHRKPKSMEAAIESFSRELRALAPDGRAETDGDDRRASEPVRRVEGRRIEGTPVNSAPVDSRPVDSTPVDRTDARRREPGDASAPGSHPG
jgi:hypothetical protein